MRFTKISVTKKAVTLARETRGANGDVEVTELESPERPLSAFVDALQAFKPYVRALLPFTVTDEQSEKMTITTLSLSEDKNHLRGLIVTAIMPVEKAYNKPLVLNMPLVREGGENPSAEAFVLTDEVLDLIKLAEEEATSYANGERVQGEMFTKEQRTASENTKAFNDNSAAAEAKSTRKPRAKKNSAEVLGVGTVYNPDKTELLDDAGLRQLLLTVERDVPVDAIARFTSSDRSLATAWAVMRQKSLLGSLKVKEVVPPEPECVKTYATAPLSAENWTGPKLVNVSEEGLAAIRSASVQ
jgi:hypothetical protein